MGGAVSDLTGAGLAAFVIVVLVPVLAIWLIVVVDVLRQPGLSPRRRALWIAACTLVWPVQILYLLLRPQQGRIEREPVRSDRQAQLVAAVLDHEAGRLDDAAYAAALRSLRGPAIG